MDNWRACGVMLPSWASAMRLFCWLERSTSSPPFCADVEGNGSSSPLSPSSLSVSSFEFEFNFSLEVARFGRNLTRRLSTSGGLFTF